VTYGYDANGNRLAQSSGSNSTNYTYYDADQPLWAPLGQITTG